MGGLWLDILAFVTYCGNLVPMKGSTEHPAYALHALVTHLDRAADTILKSEIGVSYARFLALLTVQRLGVTTQRRLSEELGVTEPAVSRIALGLAKEALLTIVTVPGGGNRRQVALTSSGTDLVDRCSELLESAFSMVMDAAEVTADDVLDLTHRMLGVVAPGSTAASSMGGAA